MLYFSVKSGFENIDEICSIKIPLEVDKIWFYQNVFLPIAKSIASQPLIETKTQKIALKDAILLSTNDMTENEAKDLWSVLNHIYGGDEGQLIKMDLNYIKRWV